MWFYLYSTGETDIKQVNLNSMLCDDLEEWNGGGGGRGAPERGDICTLIADSHCCAETYTTL